MPSPRDNSLTSLITRNKRRKFITEVGRTWATRWALVAGSDGCGKNEKNSVYNSRISSKMYLHLAVRKRYRTNCRKQWKNRSNSTDRKSNSNGLVLFCSKNLIGENNVISFQNFSTTFSPWNGKRKVWARIPLWTRPWIWCWPRSERASTEAIDHRTKESKSQVSILDLRSWNAPPPPNLPSWPEWWCWWEWARR